MALPIEFAKLYTHVEIQENAGRLRWQYRIQSAK